MKNLRLRILVVSVLAVAWSVIVLHSAPREKEWKEVQDAENKGLPRTAIEKLEPIIIMALKEKAYGEAAKAIAKKILLESSIEGNKPEEKIIRMEQVLKTAPKEIRPLLLTIQANWYWQYFQQNRWRFMRRTATAEAPGKDFTTWDLPRLFAEIDKLFSQALAEAELLKKTPVSEFNDILVKGTVPDSYRPTVYDFIAYKALEFYTSGEQAAAKPADAFEIPADSPVFEPAEQFLKWKPQTTDVQSPKLQAITIYQALLDFHKNDSDVSAFADADLARLKYGWNVAVGENKSDRYKTALNRFIEKYVEHEISTMAIYELARVIKNEGDFVKARELALRGSKVFPKSPGSDLCKNLIVEIEEKSVSLIGEYVWSKPYPEININYRNINELHFRIYELNWEKRLQRQFWSPQYLNNDEMKNLFNQKLIDSWSVKLKDYGDYKEHRDKTVYQKDLKPGYYCVVASCRPDFSEINNQTAYLIFWVSDINVVIFTRAGTIEGLVVNGNNGEPVEGAEITAYVNTSGNKFTIKGDVVKTDKDGFFRLPYESIALMISAKKGEHQVVMPDFVSTYRPATPKPREQVMFFTDRAIYRPNQTLYYKGILLYVDTEKDDYQVIPRRKVTVVLTDPNGKEVARQDVESNDYGSFSGFFTTPSGRLTGAYHLRILSGISGGASVNVEEYKRPKFNVTLDAPKEGVKLNEKVELKGKAEAFTGAPVDGAIVKYRITRQARYPIWWDWWGWRLGGGLPPSSAQEIAFGTTKTSADGSFIITFIAKPDPAVSPKSEAYFTYQIYADVTDSSGETRSANRAVNIGFTALQARIETADWLTADAPVRIIVKTETLDGEPQIAEGALKIFKLKEPVKVHKPPISMHRVWWFNDDSVDKEPDMSNPQNWEDGELVSEKGITTSTNGTAEIVLNLKSGCYRAIFETQDKYGKKTTGRGQFMVVDTSVDKFGIKVPFVFKAPQWSIEPTEEFLALWGTGYDTGRAFVQIEHRSQIIQRYWTPAGKTQFLIKIPITENMRGGFTIHLAFMKENRIWFESRRVEVPWSNKDLELSFEHFTSKLSPAQKETWTVVIKPKAGTPKGVAERTAAEMVATLYDESLDLFKQHSWLHKFNIFRRDYATLSSYFCNRELPFQIFPGRGFENKYIPVDIRYRQFIPELEEYYGYFPVRRLRGTPGAVPLAENALAFAAAPVSITEKKEQLQMAKDADGLARKAAAGSGAEADRRQLQETAATPQVDLSAVTARKNLNETAFFYPHLISDSNGTVKIQFSMPEALTRWKFFAFAHDKLCRSGFLTASAVTSKDIMVQPNPPRFLREGDTIMFPVKISNRTDSRQKGKARLNFLDAISEKNLDTMLGNTVQEIEFDVPAGESRSYYWRIQVPDGAPYLVYKAVASTGKISDGEEGYIPVLSRRILVTESLPLPIRGAGVRKFNFESLAKSGSSKTIKNVGLTVQMVSQPAWYAIMALPYLMEYPYECSEQVFNRFYANSLARHIVNSDPKIKRIFELWKGTPALDSPLEKNQDLKSVMLEETPWYRAAQDESQARKQVGILFDDNRLNAEMQSAFNKLTQMQLADGSWPWFPGGPKSDYITLYIVTGFGRMRHLGLDVNVQPAIRALNSQDNWITEIYNRIIEKGLKDHQNISEITALYLYARSFFLKDKPIAEPNREAVSYFIEQARKYWLKLPRQSQAHIALALKRFNESNKDKNDTTPQDIVKSLKERAVYSDEMGMFWRDTEYSWWWYRAPIETQAMMIEMFDEVARDSKAVEECKTWLLKQKQTQDWKTTKATADAVYALILRGENWLASDKLVEVTIGGTDITPKPEKTGQSPAVSSVEPGTGFYEKRFTANEIKPSFAEIVVKKSDSGVSWGSVHWQYLEDMSKVKPYEGTPLKVRKSLFIKQSSKKGQVLEPVKNVVNVGDELVVRIEIRVDRDMEYVHLKDQRPSGVEPVNVISGCRYQDGLVYYESTRDTASHFFIHYLPKGTYVFEYSARVQHRGKYQTGIASIQCMYAPEFNSHSESFVIEAK